jgi:isopenicillin-N epimerase
MFDNLSAHFLLDPDVVFLNHGSYGACPRPVFEAYQRWQLKLERQPVAFFDPERGITQWMRNARSVMAGLLNTGADNIVGMTNATAGLNVVAQSLGLQPGDEILTTDHEYAALEKTWAYVARRTGAKIVPVRVRLPLVDEAQFTSAVIGGMTSKTRVLFLSHITSATALVFPIEKAVAGAKERGIWTVIDGAHTPGHIPLDLAALDADFYAGNCHKWMMAPKGSAFLYVRPELQHMINPLIISHGWTDESNMPGAKGPFGNTAFLDGLEVQGTRDPSAWLTVPDAIAFTALHQWHQVAKQCSVLVQETAKRVTMLTGLPALSTPEFCAPQMVSMPVPPCDPIALKVKLLDKHNIEIPVFNWQDRTIVRVSAQGYNTQKDMDKLVEALRLHFDS